jgi:hypothetical protein
MPAPSWVPVIGGRIHPRTVPSNPGASWVGLGRLQVRAAVPVERDVDIPR